MSFNNNWRQGRNQSFPPFTYAQRVNPDERYLAEPQGGRRQMDQQATYQTNNSRFIWYPRGPHGNDRVARMYHLTGWLPRRSPRLGWVLVPDGEHSNVWHLVALQGDFIIYIPVYTPVGPLTPGPGNNSSGYLRDDTPTSRVQNSHIAVNRTIRLKKGHLHPGTERPERNRFTTH
nr:uncharacterized protein LOC106683633 isoform X1 [Halyomorpha halys]